MSSRATLRSSLLLAALVTGCSSEEAPPPPPPPPPPKVEAPAEDSGEAPTGRARPRITKLSYSPGRPTTADHIRLEVAAEDPDGSPVRFKYQWYINGQKRISLNRDNLPAQKTERGDKVYCEVRAIDTDNDEAFRKSPTIEIVNAAPSFLTDPRSVRSLDGLTLDADDPDEDDLTFSLTGAPAGMTIDPQSGRISYAGSKDEKGGQYNLVAKVADGNGGTATWTFGVGVSAGSAAQAKADAAAGKGGKSATTPSSDADGEPKKRERRRTAW